MPPGPLHLSSRSECRRATVARVAVALVVLALIAPMPAVGMVPAAASPPTSATDATARDAGSPGAVATAGDEAPASGMQAGFDADTYEEHRGDVVEFAVTLDGIDSATLRLDGPDGYAAVVDLHDQDGDGTVSVSFNTYLAGEGDRAYAAAGSDRVTVRNESTVEGTAAAGTYGLAVDGVDAGDPDDTAILYLRERSTDGLTVWSALASERSNLTDLDGIEAAKRSRGLHHADHVTMEDLLVLEIRASGLSGPLAAQDGPNATARFFRMLDDPDAPSDDSETGIALTALENVTTVSTSEDPARLVLASHNSTSVVADPANDTYYVVVDFQAVPKEVDDHGDLDLGDVFDVRFVVGTDSALSDGSLEVEGAWFKLVPRQVAIPGPYPIYLDPGPNRTISGWTNVPPGYVVTVTIYAPGEVDFEATREVTVGPDDRFEVEVDLSEIPEGTELGLRVVFRDRVLADEPGLFRVETIPAEVEILDVRNEGFVAVDANVTLGLGGFVVLHENTSDGRFLGRSKYLPPGTHNVTVVGAHSASGVVEVAVVLHRDTDDDQRFDDHPRADPPYLDEGDPVNATAEVPPESDSSTSTPTPPQATPPTTTPTPAETWTPSPPPPPWEIRTPTPTGPTIPGFGILPAVAALFGAVLLGANRRVRER